MTVTASANTFSLLVCSKVMRFPKILFSSKASVFRVNAGALTVLPQYLQGVLRLDVGGIKQCVKHSIIIFVLAI